MCWLICHKTCEHQQITSTDQKLLMFIFFCDLVIYIVIPNLDSLWFLPTAGFHYTGTLLTPGHSHFSPQEGTGNRTVPCIVENPTNPKYVCVSHLVDYILSLKCEMEHYFKSFSHLPSLGQHAWTDFQRVQIIEPQSLMYKYNDLLPAQAMIRNCSCLILICNIINKQTVKGTFS